MIIWFANYLIFVSNEKMCVKIGKHLCNSNSAKEKAV